MPKFNVQAVTRAGYDGAWRAGRKWPSNGPTEVEVVQQDEDPPHDPAKGIVLGKKSYEALKADPNIVIREPGDPFFNAQSTDQLKAENERLRAELEALKARQAGGAGEEHTSPRKR